LELFWSLVLGVWCFSFYPVDRLFEIVSEDADLLVINKPAGLVCHPTKGDQFSSLISRARLYLQGGAAHIINRLDRETSGVILVAKNSEAAGLLGKAWESRSVRKVYWAIVHGRFPDQHRVIDAPLGKDEKSVVAIKDCVRADGARSQTECFLEKVFERDGQVFSLVRVQPLTGRKHQIRIHLQAAGHPIVGDKLYGQDENLYLSFVKHMLTEEQERLLILPHQALHAGELAFNWQGKELVFQAEPEQWFREFAEINSAFNLRDSY
jgi:23S rRNA pseudouridine1911/1915/1917 synthase